MDDGAELDFGPGDVVLIPAGHDADAAALLAVLLVGVLPERPFDGDAAARDQFLGGGFGPYQYPYRHDTRGNRVEVRPEPSLGSRGAGSPEQTARAIGPLNEARRPMYVMPADDE